MIFLEVHFTILLPFQSSFPFYLRFISLVELFRFTLVFWFRFLLLMLDLGWGGGDDMTKMMMGRAPLSPNKVLAEWIELLNYGFHCPTQGASGLG